MLQQLSAAMAAARITCTRGEVGTAGKEELSAVSPGDRTPSLARSHAMVQTRISGGTSGVNGEARIAKTHQERE